MPFRALAKMTGGAISMDMARAILHMVNGHFFGGAARLIGAKIRLAKEHREIIRKIGNDEKKQEDKKWETQL